MRLGLSLSLSRIGHGSEGGGGGPPDAPVILGPAETPDFTPTITGTGTNAATVDVEIMEEGVALVTGQATVDVNGDWSFTVPDVDTLEGGAYTVRAQQTVGSDVSAWSPDFDMEIQSSAASAALLARLSTPTTPQRTAINAFVLKGEADGWWSLIDLCYVPRFGDTADSLKNWKSTSFTLTKFVSGTHTFSSSGWRGDGTTSYLNTNFNLTTASSPNAVRDSHHALVYCPVDSQMTSTEFGGSDISIGVRDTSNLAGIRSAATTADTVTNASSLGCTAINRTVNTEFLALKNGVLLTSGTKTRSSSAFVSQQLFLGARNNGAGTQFGCSLRIVGGFILSGGLTQPQYLSMATAFNTLQAAL